VKINFGSNAQAEEQKEAKCIELLYVGRFLHFENTKSIEPSKITRKIEE
jgi:hypothetical protein